MFKLRIIHYINNIRQIAFIKIRSQMQEVFEFNAELPLALGDDNGAPFVNGLQLVLYSSAASYKTLTSKSRLFFEVISSTEHLIGYSSALRPNPNVFGM